MFVVIRQEHLSALHRESKAAFITTAKNCLKGRKLQGVVKPLAGSIEDLKFTLILGAKRAFEVCPGNLPSIWGDKWKLCGAPLPQFA